MERHDYSSGTAWEDAYGYARAIRIGPHVWVAGTTATDADGQLVGAGDAYRQTMQALQNVRRALEALGADLRHVVRTRLYVVDIARDHEAVGRAHGELFHDVRPVTAMVEVRALIAPAMLVEIEAEAFVGG